VLDDWGEIEIATIKDILGFAEYNSQDKELQEAVKALFWRQLRLCKIYL